MVDRKVIRRQARQHLKRHYMLLVLLCAVSIFLGTEFNGVVSNAQSWYDVLTGQVTEMDVGGVREERGAMDRIVEDLIDDNLAAARDDIAARMQALRDGGLQDAGAQDGCLRDGQVWQAVRSGAGLF